MHSQTDIERIRTCFENYKRALLTNNGSLATEVIDSGTIQYYQSIVTAAKTTTKDQILELRPIERFLVLSLRIRVPAEIVLRMDGKTAFAYGVDQGWVGVDEVRDTLLGEIKLYKQAATAEAIISGRVVDENFRFVQEDQKWKIDISGSIPKGEQELMELKNESGLETEEEFFFWALSALTGKKVTNKIWIPLDHFR